MINPTGVSIVDTYGIMFSVEMTRNMPIYWIIHLTGISCWVFILTIIRISRILTVYFFNLNLQRNIIVDGSLLGMGKNSGNAHTEVLALFMNKNKLKKFGCDQILECAVTDIQRFLTKQEWGYNVNNLVTAICECSPNWIRYYIKNTLSISDILKILNKLPEEKHKLVSFF